MPSTQKLENLGAEFSELIPNVFLLLFKSHRRMVDTFLRPREHYESSEFRGKCFSRKELDQWYRSNKKPSCYAQWGAFNMPLHVFCAFENGEFNPLSKDEKQLLQFSSKLKPNAYLIATSKIVEKESSRLKHEMAHALYATDNDYRLAVKKLLQNADLSPINNWLDESNYHRSRYLDEAHAYLLDGSSYLKSEMRISPKPYTKLISDLKSLYKKYIPSFGS
jgi:hypothetical protein